MGGMAEAREPNMNRFFKALVILVLFCWIVSLLALGSLIANAL